MASYIQHYMLRREPYFPEANCDIPEIILHLCYYGRALRTHKGVKPVFVSVGNQISLDTACQIAMSFVTKESHIPLPTRLADLETHIARKAILESSPEVVS